MITPKSSELREEAKFNHENAIRRIDEVHAIAIKIAPGFRDKFDLSEKKHFEQWADMAWSGAEAFLDRKIQAVRDANKDRQKTEEKANAAALREREEEEAKKKGGAV